MLDLSLIADEFGGLYLQGRGMGWDLKTKDSFFPRWTKESVLVWKISVMISMRWYARYLQQRDYARLEMARSYSRLWKQTLRIRLSTDGFNTELLVGML